MHWLTWHQLWDFVHTWEGAAATALAIVAAIYYGPRRVLETWDWYLGRFFDTAVWAVVKNRKHLPQGAANNWSPNPAFELSYSEEEIAKAIGRSKKSVHRSLVRLEKLRKVKEMSDGWRRAD